MTGGSVTTVENLASSLPTTSNSTSRFVRRLTKLDSGIEQKYGQSIMVLEKSSVVHILDGWQGLHVDK